MKRALLLLILLRLSFSATSQASFSFFGHRSDFEEVHNHFSSQSSSDALLLRHGLGFSFGNLISLPGNRFAFHPNISVTTFKKYETDYTSFIFSFEKNSVELSMLQANFDWETRFYPFEYKPKNKKQGKLNDWEYFANGFFLKCFPGISIIQQRIEYESNIFSPEVFRKLYFRMGLGVGFDVILNKYLTISPSVSWNRIQDMSTESFSRLLAPVCAGCPSFASYAFEEEIEYNHFTYGITFFFRIFNTEKFQ